MSDGASGARLQAVRAKTGLSQRGLAKKLGVSPQAVSKWESGEAAPKLATARKLATLSGFTVEWILSGAETRGGSGGSNVVYYTGGGRKVALLGDTETGLMERRNARKPSIYVQTHFPCSAEAFALTIKGDSMMPAFHDGDVVVIDPELAPTPGDFVFVEMHDGTKLFRKYRPQATPASHSKIYDLVPLNPDWPTLRVNSEKQGTLKGVMSERIAPRRGAG